MRADDYRHLLAVCLAMARQSESPDVQARWFKLAEAWSRRSSAALLASCDQPRYASPQLPPALYRPLPFVRSAVWTHRGTLPVPAHARQASDTTRPPTQAALTIQTN
jgi:hypothetical protein